MATLRGPDGPIHYERDGLGYPKIDARDLAEGAWACGWFHATDRLIQVQIALAIARGEGLTLMGENPVARHVDRMTRLHRFTDDLDAQVEKLSPEVRAVIDPYCAGFTAGVRARRWPLLLRAAGVKPRPYRPQDMVLLYRIISWFGLTQLAEMGPLLVGDLMAHGASAAAIALLVGDAATPAEIAGAPAIAWPAGLELFVGSPAGGSNAIAIAAARSATGGALLAADPHMEIARIPPVLYASHITHGTGGYLQGMFVPGLWWPSFGRTARAAVAYTYGHVASVDVRAVRCRRGELYHGASWRPLARRTVTVAVKKRPTETWTFWDSELGTVVGDAHGEQEVTLPCVCWSGVRETYRDMNAALAIVRSSDVDASIAANRELSALSLDAVVADATGRIGHVLGGRMDRRPATSGGVVPRAPDGPPVRHDEASRPLTVDPRSGWIVSANARPSEPGAAAWVPMPEPDARRERLRTLVAATPSAGLDDLARLLLDACDAGAERMLAIWAPHLPDDPRAKALVAWAAAQAGHGDLHFAQLTLWNELHDQACRLLLHDVLGAARADHLLDALLGMVVFRHHLDAALGLTRPEHLDAAALRALLARAFPRALASAASPERRLPRADRFRNILFAGKFPWFGIDSKPITNRGGPTTPNQVSAFTLGEQRLVFGAAGRYLADLSKPGGWYCISGGASERRLGKGYGAGLEAWAAGEFRALGDTSGPAPSAHARERMP